MDFKEVLRQRDWEVVILDLDRTIVDLAADWQRVKLVVDKFRSDSGLQSCAGLDHAIFDFRRNVGSTIFFKLCEEISRIEIANVKSTSFNSLLLGDLKTFEKKIAVFSANCRATVQHCLRLMPELEDRIHLIVGKEDVQAPKPSPEGLLNIMSNLSLSREQMLFVGDSENDLASGQQARISTVIIAPMTNMAIHVGLFNS